MAIVLSYLEVRGDHDAVVDFVSNNCSDKNVRDALAAARLVATDREVFAQVASSLVRSATAARPYPDAIGEVLDLSVSHPEPFSATEVAGRELAQWRARNWGVAKSPDVTSLTFCAKDDSLVAQYNMWAVNGTPIGLLECLARLGDALPVSLELCWFEERDLFGGFSLNSGVLDVLSDDDAWAALVRCDSEAFA